MDSCKPDIADLQANPRILCIVILCITATRRFQLMRWPRRESGLCLPEKVDTGSDFLPGLVGEHHFSSVAYASMLRARE
jgi:hypothetical protein